MQPIMRSTVFASFQGIIGGVPKGAVKSVFQKIEGFPSDYKEAFIYYIRYSNEYHGELRIRTLGLLYLILEKSLTKLNKFFFRRPGYVVRYWQEVLFDWFLSIKIKEPVNLISTAYLLKTIKKNKKLGGCNIFLAGNPDDREINSLLRKEMKKYKVIFSDAYTYPHRIDFVGRSLDSFDHIITYSEISLNTYRVRIPENKLSKISAHIVPGKNNSPNVLDNENDKLSFCFVAHPFWLKGLPYLLEAWSKIENAGIQLRIAGNINRDLQKVIDDKYSYFNNVEYLGWVPDLNEFLNNSHVCVVPSLLDAGPATVAEAMICGLPVIVSDGCGSSELVNEGKNGLVFKAGETNDLANKINWFIDNQDKVEQMGLEARNTIEHLRFGNQNKAVAEHIIEVIDQLQSKV